MVILEKNKFKKNEYFYIESPENITLQKKKNNNYYSFLERK